MSDLHLEVRAQYKDFLIPPNAPYLILAGDIGRLCDYDLYLEFLRMQCAQFNRVFLVLGNHEFFGISRAEGLQLALSLEQEACLSDRLKLLNRTMVDIADGVTVLGCTLQSHISIESYSIVEAKVKDFKRIHAWTVDDHNAEHAADVAWLQQEIRAIRTSDRVSHRKPRRILVVSHHAPVRRGSSKPAEEESPWADAFATELLESKTSGADRLEMCSSGSLDIHIIQLASQRAV